MFAAFFHHAYTLKIMPLFSVQSILM